MSTQDTKQPYAILGHDDCLLLEYATEECVPKHVHQLLQQYTQQKLSQAEILFLLIYIVALECGFATERSFETHKGKLQPVPAISCFQVENVRLLTQEPADFSLEYERTVFRMHLRSILTIAQSQKRKDTTLDKEATETHLLQSNLMAIISGDLLIVTISPAAPTSDRGFSVCLPIGRYVLNIQSKQKPLFHRFFKMTELSIQLREQLFNPLRAQQVALLKAHVYPNLLGLPAELYDGIFCYLNPNQLNIVANVNRHLNYHSTHSKHRMGRRIAKNQKDDDKHKD